MKPEEVNIGGKNSGLQIEGEESLHVASSLGTGASVAHAVESEQHGKLSSSTKMVSHEMASNGKAVSREVKLAHCNLQTTSSQLLGLSLNHC